MTPRKLLLSAIASIAAVCAQGYTGYLDSASCSAVTGWAWDSTQPNTPITVDLYDYITPVATVTANVYRADLYAAGYGNGYHGFSFTIPTYLKDGNQHVIDAYFGGTRITLYYTQSFTCSAGSTGYQYYFNDSLTSINSSYWTQNGSVSAGSSGLTATSSNGGSLISTVAVPDGTSDYEVKAVIDTPSYWSGAYVIYLRASSNAMTGPGATGTFYSIELNNNFTYPPYYANVVINKCVNGSVTQLQSTMMSIHNGVVLRAWAQGSSIGLIKDGLISMTATDSSISSGKPGIGGYNLPSSGSSINGVNLGPADRIAPGTPSSTTISTSVLPTQLTVKFAGVSDDPNGTGVSGYLLYRDGSWVASSRIPEFTDNTVSAGTSHSYTIYAADFRDNLSGAASFSVTTPPSGSVDPRRVGTRPTGTYWGASPEQIDVLSGNLNLTIPLLTAQGRNGWSVPFNLTYNSQSWRQDSGGTWNLGADVGYGYGWRLSAGSIVPFYSGAWTLDHYQFIDSNGAEYRLNQNNGGIWSSSESVYVWYDSSANILHFRDGSFWVMGSISSGGEPDAGTMYPTVIENANGNQILVTYFEGNQLPFINSSARIQTITDVRAVARSGGTNTYAFLYTTDAIPHLTTIQNAIGTSEAYTFTFSSSANLLGPFPNNTYSAPGGFVGLQTMTTVGINMTYNFVYDQSGEMTQATFPYGGYFK
jgi:hypothetical protein